MRRSLVVVAGICAAGVFHSPVYAQGNDKLSVMVEKLHQELDAQKESLLLLRKDYDRLVAQSQSDKEKLYTELGAAYTKAKMFDAAIRTYEALLKLNPRNSQAHYMLGLLYKQEENDTERAVGHLKQYLALNPHAKDRTDVEYLVRMFEKR